MSRWTPCKRAELIRKLRRLGFDGPFSGTRHQLVVFAQKRLAIPSNLEYSVPQSRMLIREAEGVLGRNITLEEWSSLWSDAVHRVFTILPTERGNRSAGAFFHAFWRPGLLSLTLFRPSALMRFLHSCEAEDFAVDRRKPRAIVKAWGRKEIRAGWFSG